MQTPGPPSLHQGKAAARAPRAALRAKAPACPGLTTPWGEVSGEGGWAGSGPVLGCRLPARHAVPSAPAAFSWVALQEDSCLVSTPHHSSDTTRLPDLPPTLKSTTRCVCLLCFMVSAASIISSEERLSKCPSTCPYVPPDTGSVRAGTQGGCRLERKWWMPDPQAGLHGLCTREDPQPSWMEF